MAKRRRSSADLSDVDKSPESQSQQHNHADIGNSNNNVSEGGTTNGDANSSKDLPLNSVITTDDTAVSGKEKADSIPYGDGSAQAQVASSSIKKKHMVSQTPSPIPPQASGRLRVSRACDRCKRQKIKCDGQKPCRMCLRYDCECTYGNPQQTNKQSGTNKSHRHSGGTTNYSSKLTDNVSVDEVHRGTQQRDEYGIENGSNKDRRNHNNNLSRPYRMSGTLDSSQYGDDNSSSTSETRVLRERISQLESLLIQISSQRPEETRKVYEQTETRKSESEKRNDKRISTLFDNQFARTQTGIGTIFETSKDRFIYANAITYAFFQSRLLWNNLTPEMRRVVTAPRIQAYGWNMSGSHFLPPRSFYRTPNLVPQEEGLRLLDFFFKFVNPVFAILYEKKFRKMVSVQMARTDQCESRVFTALLHIVYAISLRFSEHEHQYRSGLEESLFEDGYAIIEAFSFEWESLEIIQGWLLITLYLRTTHRQCSAWSALGRAIRMTMGMSLMSNMEPFGSVTRETIQARRNVFWSAFTFDAFLSTEGGRVTSFQLESITLPLPSEYSDDGWSTPISHALNMLAVVLLKNRQFRGESCADKVIQQGLAACDQHLTEYGLDQDLAATPSSAGLQQQVPPSIIAFLRLSYHEVVLTYYLYERMPKDERTQILNRDECLQSADGIISTLESLRQTDESEILRPWWLTMSCIYSAGMIFNADMASNLALGALHHQRQLSKCIELLEYLVSKNRFIMAREALWALKTVVSMTTVNVSDVLQGLHSVNMHQADSEAVNKGRSPAVLLEKDASTKGGEDAGVMDASGKRQQQERQQQQQQQQGVQSNVYGGGVNPDQQRLQQQSLLGGGSTTTTGGQQQINPTLGLPSEFNLDWFNQWTWDIENALTLGVPNPNNAQLPPPPTTTATTTTHTQTSPPE